MPPVSAVAPATAPLPPASVAVASATAPPPPASVAAAFSAAATEAAFAPPVPPPSTAPSATNGLTARTTTTPLPSTPAPAAAAAEPSSQEPVAISVPSFPHKPTPKNRHNPSLKTSYDIVAQFILKDGRRLTERVDRSDLALATSSELRHLALRDTNVGEQVSAFGPPLNSGLAAAWREAAIRHGHDELPLYTRAAPAPRFKLCDTSSQRAASPSAYDKPIWRGGGYSRGSCSDNGGYGGYGGYGGAISTGAHGYGGGYGHGLGYNNSGSFRDSLAFFPERPSGTDGERHFATPIGGFGSSSAQSGKRGRSAMADETSTASGVALVGAPPLPHGYADPVSNVAAGDGQLEEEMRSAKQPRRNSGVARASPAPPMATSSSSCQAAQRILKALGMLDTPPLRLCQAPSAASGSSGAFASQRTPTMGAAAAAGGATLGYQDVLLEHDMPPRSTAIDATPTRLLAGGGLAPAPAHAAAEPTQRAGAFEPPTYTPAATLDGGRVGGGLGGGLGGGG